MYTYYCAEKLNSYNKRYISIYRATGDTLEYFHGFLEYYSGLSNWWVEASTTLDRIISIPEYKKVDKKWLKLHYPEVLK